VTVKMTLDRVALAAGLLTGLAGVVFVLASGSVAGGQEGFTSPGVTATTAATAEPELTLAAAPTGELGVSPTEAALGRLDPGGSASAAFSVRNQTGKALLVSLRVPLERGGIREALEISVGAPAGPLFEGLLTGAAEWTPPILLDPGETAELEVELRLPAGTPAYLLGPAVVALEFRGRAEG